MRIHRREQRWADKDFNKANLGSEWKKPFAGCSHAKGIVLEKIGIEAKQPNSAIRKCVRVQLIKNGKKIAAFVPRDGCLNFTDENDEVLIAGFGRKGPETRARCCDDARNASSRRPRRSSATRDRRTRWNRRE